MPNCVKLNEYTVLGYFSFEMFCECPMPVSYSLCALFPIKDRIPIFWNRKRL